MEVSSSSFSWRTGLSVRSNVQLLMTGGNLNTGFSIRTAYCLLPMRMRLTSQVKHRPRQPPTVLNATPEAFSAGISSLEKLQPSLVTRQGGDLTSWVWLNGKFGTKPWTQTVPEATQSPPDLIQDEVSEPESA